MYAMKDSGRRELFFLVFWEINRLVHLPIYFLFLQMVLDKKLAIYQGALLKKNTNSARATPLTSSNTFDEQKSWHKKADHHTKWAEEHVGQHVGSGRAEMLGCLHKVLFALTTASCHEGLHVIQSWLDLLWDSIPAIERFKVA